MDKLLFLFHRKDGLSRRGVLRALPRRPRPARTACHRTMDGYTVNLVDTEGAGAPDAITEVWTASATDFFDPAQVVRHPRRRQGADDRPRLVHRSVRHLHRRGAGRARGERRGRGRKRVSCYLEGDIGTGGRTGRHRCGRAPRGAGAQRRRAAYTTIVSTWAPTADALGPPSGVSFDVREYRKKTPPS